MAKGGKSSRFRSGDMAEALGYVLLQPLCAVVPVPRQEDWGIFDAVATILQSQGDFLFAEQSFFVQFKARTAKPMLFTGKRLETLLQRELAFMVGKVDLSKSEIELFYGGEILAHPNAADAVSIELRFGKGKLRLSERKLVAFLSKPILRWRLPDLLDPLFRREAYDILGEWLTLDRERRLLSRLGILDEIVWETNSKPVKTGVSQSMTKSKGFVVPIELTSAIRLIAALASSHLELVGCASTLIQWARDHGVDPDPSGMAMLFAFRSEARQRERQARELFPDATATLALIVNGSGPDWLDFWLGMSRTSGNFSQLREKGFEVTADPETNVAKSLTLGSKWLSSRQLELLGDVEGVFVLRGLPDQATQ